MWCSEGGPSMARYAPTAQDGDSSKDVGRAMTLENREVRGIGPNKGHVYPRQGGLKLPARRTPTG